MKKILFLSLLFAALTTQAQKVTTLKPQPTPQQNVLPKAAYTVRYWNNTGIKKMECISYHVSTGILVMLVVENGKLTRKELSISSVSGISEIGTGKIMKL